MLQKALETNTSQQRIPQIETDIAATNQITTVWPERNEEEHLDRDRVWQRSQKPRRWSNVSSIGGQPFATIRLGRTLTQLTLLGRLLAFRWGDR